jgi:hypothetical protein
MFYDKLNNSNVSLDLFVLIDMQFANAYLPIDVRLLIFIDVRLVLV